MNKYIFEQRLTSSHTKGWLWTLVKSIVIKWLYDNADVILPILLEKVFGVDKADKFLKAMDQDTQSFTACGPRPLKPEGQNGDWECIGGAWKWIEDLG